MAIVKGRPVRLTRQERRAETRQRLVDAAQEVFAERGFHGASVEEIADRAGFTRGAFYSNFEDKHDVLLALYDQRIQTEITDVSEVMTGATSPEELLTALRDRSKTTFDTSWHMLTMELSLYAMRHPDARPRFAKRLRALRGAYARSIKKQFDMAGIEPPAPLGDLALILQALDDGFATQYAVDPSGVRRDSFFDALTLLFRAVAALSQQTVGAGAQD